MVDESSLLNVFKIFYMEEKMPISLMSTKERINFMGEVNEQRRARN